MIRSRATATKGNKRGDSNDDVDAQRDGLLYVLWLLEKLPAYFDEGGLNVHWRVTPDGALAVQLEDVKWSAWLVVAENDVEIASKSVELLLGQMADVNMTPPMPDSRRRSGGGTRAPGPGNRAAADGACARAD